MEIAWGKKHLWQKLETNLPFLRKNLRHPLRLLNLLGVRLCSNRLRPIHNPFLPWSLDIEPTVACNLRCIMCPSDKIREQRKVRNMSFESFKKVIDSIPTLMKVTVQGLGEPLLAPDFFNMVNYANQKDIAVTTTINATFIDEKIAKKVVESGLSRIYISLDGATKETYEKIRRGANFERTLDGIRRLVNTRKLRGKPFIDLWMLWIGENIYELPRMLDLAIELGVDSLTIQPDMTFWGRKELRESIKGISLSKQSRDVAEVIKETQNNAKKKGFNFVYDRKTKFTAKKPCVWPWQAGFISTDGRIVPCCLLGNPETYNLGNILETPYKEIWNGEKMKRLRKTLKEGKLYQFCRDCHTP